MSKCLYCYQELEDGQVDFHPACARKFFDSETAPILPYTRENMSELARQVIRTSASVTGVQAKMSLDVNRGHRWPLGQIYLQTAKWQVSLSPRIGRSHHEDGRGGPYPHRPSYAHPHG